MLDPIILDTVAGYPLYYPASENDFYTPIEVFAPYIRDFWFCDLHYFDERRPARKAKPVLDGTTGYALRDVTVSGPEAASTECRHDSKSGRCYRWIEPCVRTEIYTHHASGHEIRIHRRRGFGFSGLITEIQRLGVFFYRGDSQEGSRTLWLTQTRRGKNLIGEVLDRLVDGGLIVTDGSNCYPGHPSRPDGVEPTYPNPYRNLGQFWTDDYIGADAVGMARPFEDDKGRKFECMGYVGEQRGPTLVWRVRKHTDA